MQLHSSTFKFLTPTEEQFNRMSSVREAAAVFAETLTRELPDGPDKTFVLRQHRSNVMWAHVAITREADGAPRKD